MKVTDYKGYEVHLPTSGGKAGKGCNKTSTIQVRRGGCIQKQFRWTLGIAFDRQRAIEKAKAWIAIQRATEGQT